MRRLITVLSAAMCAVLFLSFPVNAQAIDNKWSRLVEESGKVLEEVQRMPDTGIPDELLSKCSAIAIIPSAVSGGFVIGGQYGQGIMMVRNEKSGKWSPPAVFNAVGGSFGFQIGGQATDLILLVMNRRSVDGILQGKFKLGVDAAVSAGPVGRNVQAETDIQLKGGILSYSRSRGLFAGVKLDGAVISENAEGNEGLYGTSLLTPEEIFFGGKVKMPKSADGVLKVLNQYKYKK